MGITTTQLAQIAAPILGSPPRLLHRPWLSQVVWTLEDDYDLEEELAAWCRQGTSVGDARVPVMLYEAHDAVLTANELVHISAMVERDVRFDSFVQAGPHEWLSTKETSIPPNWVIVLEQGESAWSVLVVQTLDLIEPDVLMQ